MKTIHRRHFLSLFGAGLIGILGSSSLLSACANSSGGGGGGSPANNPQSGGNCPQNGSSLETTSVSEGHTHTFQLTAVEINTADPNAVFQVSNNGHTHNVQLTPQEYQTLQGNTGVSLTTSAAADGHSHNLIVNCA